MIGKNHYLPTAILQLIKKKKVLRNRGWWVSSVPTSLTMDSRSNPSQMCDNNDEIFRLSGKAKIN